MNYLNMLQGMKDESKLAEVSYILAIRALVNWCNGTLMTISRQRLTNIKAGRDADYVAAVHEPDPENDQDVMPTAPGLTPTQRGECFASIRKAAMNIAIEHGWDGFNKPRLFKEYIESRVQGLRSSVPTEADIRAEMKNSAATTYEEAKAWCIASFKEQAAKLEEMKDDLIAEDSHYEDDIDFDEALGLLGILAEHRIRVKVIDSLMYEVDRINIVRQGFPNFEELRTKRLLMLGDASALNKELQVFTRMKKVEIQKELEAGTNQRSLVEVTDGHKMRLELYERQKAEEAGQKAA